MVGLAGFAAERIDMAELCVKTFKSGVRYLRKEDMFLELMEAMPPWWWCDRIELRLYTYAGVYELGDERTWRLVLDVSNLLEELNLR